MSISVIISDRYGPSMDDIWQDDGGRVSWLENPGDATGNWVRHTIGNSPGMHRLRAGHFTRKDRVQIAAVPIVIASSDLTTAAPVIIFTAPENPKDTHGDWPSEIVWKRHLVHEVVVVSAEECGGEMAFDQIVLAGRDGVDVLWYDGSAWQTFNVGTGLKPTPNNPYWGAGSVAVGRVGNDYAGYICLAEVRMKLVIVYSSLTPCFCRHSTATPFPSTPSHMMLLLA
jgi:aldos-2-ulose dehydratase